jgi:hypothetical protein
LIWIKGRGLTGRDYVFAQALEEVTCFIGRSFCLITCRQSVRTYCGACPLGERLKR